MTARQTHAKLGLLIGALTLSHTSWAQASNLRHHDIETVATNDVALYICAQAYPKGLPALKLKLDASLRDLSTAPAVLRQQKAYTGIYNTQLNAMLATPPQERQAFCKEASE